MWVSLANTEQLAAVEGVPEVCLEYDLNPIFFCPVQKKDDVFSSGDVSVPRQ